MAWLYQIKNNTDGYITVPVSVFLATDTGGRHLDRYHPEIESLIVENGEHCENALTMAGEFSPHQTKKAIACFEKVDPNAQEINLYVMGLSHFFFWRWRLVDYPYRIVYKRTPEGWELVEHGFSKDTTQRDYESLQDTAGKPLTRRPISPSEEIRFMYTAPQGPSGRRREDIEDFFRVYDAIFSADKIKTPEKALELWEAITEQATYKEIDLDFPEKTYNWWQTREKNKELLEINHSLITGEPFEKPSEALWQVSKVDGYRELKDGVLEVYTRFVRYYKKEYHYGLSIFRIKNTLPYQPIPRWNQYPYTSRWKVFDCRWRHITKPDWNKGLFVGYPKVSW